MGQSLNWWCVNRREQYVDGLFESVKTDKIEKSGRLRIKVTHRLSDG